MKLFQITEDDLATLEKALPRLSDAIMPVMDNRTRVHLRQVRRIVSDVRWNYGPPEQVEVVPTDDQAS